MPCRGTLTAFSVCYFFLFRCRMNNMLFLLWFTNSVPFHLLFRLKNAFSSWCQEAAVLTSLKALVSLIFDGTNLYNQEDNESQAFMTFGQCIVFNMKKKVTKNEHASYSSERVPRLPLYVGLTIHNMTRSKRLVKLLYQLGLNASYDRIIQIEDQLTTSSLCEQFIHNDVVCPDSWKKSLFTVGAIDNIDHNLTSMTALSSFHNPKLS